MDCKIREGDIVLIGEDAVKVCIPLWVIQEKGLVGQVLVNDVCTVLVKPNQIIPYYIPMKYLIKVIR